MAHSFDESLLGDRLLALLRRESGDSSLAYRSPPTRITGGNETLIYAFELERPPDALRGPLILRVIPEEYDPQRALWEAAVQEAVVEQGYLAPRPRLAWTDPADVGRALLIMDRVPGGPLGFSSDVSMFFSNSLLRRAWFLLRTAFRAMSIIDEMTMIMADQMARLHQLDPEPARRKAEEGNIPPAIYDVDCFLDEIARQVDVESLNGFGPALAWLRAHKPKPSGDAICHGDFFNVNILVDRSTVTGVIDWSFARVGDPAFDVGATLVGVSGTPGIFPAPVRPLIDWFVTRAVRRFRERYEQVAPLSEEGVRYWTAVCGLSQLLSVATFRLHGPTQTREYLGGGDLAHTPGFLRRLTESVRSVTGETVTLPPAKSYTGA